MFNQPITELIQKRISCRTYDPKPIPVELRSEMKRVLEDLNAQAQSQIRFQLINTIELEADKKIKLGTYGVLSGVHTFIIASIVENEGNPFELGYLFEMAVLKATDLGLGTVWLGGTFSRSDFEKHLKLASNEAIAIVSPLGIPKDHRSLIDSAMRFGAGSNHRKPWDELFFDSSSPLLREEAHVYAKVMDMVQMGPSASNKQPWRIIKDHQAYHLFLERTPGYGSMMKYDLQLNDAGIAKCHFELACQELKLKGTWVFLEPNPTHLNWEYMQSWVYES